MYSISNNSSYAYGDKKFAALGLLLGIGSAVFALASNKVEHSKNKDIKGMLPIDAEVTDEHIVIVTHTTSDEVSRESERRVDLKWHVGFSDYTMTVVDNAYDYEIGHPTKLLYNPADPEDAVGYVEKERADGLEFVSILLAAAGVISVLGGVKPVTK